MNVSELIRIRRIEKGLTLEEIGAACGVGKSTVLKWEKGMIKNIGSSRLEKLAKILDISPSALIDTRYFTGGLPYTNDEAHVFCDFREFTNEEEQKAVLNFLDNAKTASGKDLLMKLEEMDYYMTDKELSALKQFRALNQEGQSAVLTSLEIAYGNPKMLAPPADESAM